MGNIATWNTVYQDIALLIGEEKTILLYQAYKGTQVAFPMRLVSREHVKYIIQKSYPKCSINQLALETGYSERNIRRLLKELKIEMVNPAKKCGSITQMRKVDNNE
ncbi:hypothetical protein BFC19_07600 [Brochothrix thermosphacta]|uniref:hypothetical protein n=1 Tax=Brochothrix thermosphacta TaxID=2756 RepID=UPI000E7452B1|nr:hypothetical protein [Brochothrix thermosphacta]ANZ95252.1 hypothetical protein BFC19_07600 [Brochothrix thermosphacta]MDO7864070.1 hypothetical protein [Brochothrix thermosphacta]